MVRSIAEDLPEQVKNKQSVNLAAGNGGQKMSQYSWFTVYYFSTHILFSPHTKSTRVELNYCVTVSIKSSKVM